MGRYWMIVFLLNLAQVPVQAQEFESHFSDSDFCEFDLLRMPLITSPAEACGPEDFAPWAKIVEFRNKPYVDVTLSSNVPFTKKYNYKMELSVPNEHRYRDDNRTEHEFSIVVPKLPDSALVFDYLHENATAFVLAQWHATNDKSPPMALRLLNTKELVFTIDIDVPGGKGENSASERITLWRGNVVENQPMSFYVLARWDEKYGFLDVELNGKKIVGYTGPLGQTMVGDRTYYFKYGLYHSYKNKMPEDFRFKILLGDYRQNVF